MKAKDVTEPKFRRHSDIKEIYQSVIAAITLRCLHEVLEADTASNVRVVAFNGFVRGVDPATGQDIRPYLYLSPNDP